MGVQYLQVFLVAQGCQYERPAADCQGLIPPQQEKDEGCSAGPLPGTPRLEAAVLSLRSGRTGDCHAFGSAHV